MYGKLYFPYRYVFFAEISNRNKNFNLLKLLKKLFKKL